MIGTAVEAANALFYFVCVYSIVDRVCNAYQYRSSKKEGDE